MTGGTCVRRRAAAAAGLLGVALAAVPAGAFEFFDGRLQVHGFYELQLRTIADGFDGSNDYDVTQWANILNLEIEADIAPDGWGPFDLVTAFARIEVRYDCIYRRGCWMFPNAGNAFGDAAKKLPERLNDGRRFGLTGTVTNPDTRFYRGEPPEEFSWIFFERPRGSRRPYGIESTPAFGGQFDQNGADDVPGTADDPAPFVYDLYFGADDRRCKFSTRQTRGSQNGRGLQILGPLDPQCKPEPLAALSDKPNPFRPRDVSPIAQRAFGQQNPARRAALNASGVFRGQGIGALPYRWYPEVGFEAGAPPWVAKGLWIPNAGLAERLRQRELVTNIPQFSEHDLSWNRGLHQQTWRELKELYVDLEMFESRLWLRIGRQTIVWGKTELFRNQDQFNPQDLALASLPSLEESRTALWSARGIFSLYEVGPLQDVRIELAVNFDRVFSSDLGQCNEPYTIVLLCAGAFGLLSHGTLGIGFAGAQKIPDPWDDWKAFEVGGRIEWRWDRFSFALTDFWGYGDFPTIRKIFTYSRNVDPVSGRPRRTTTDGRCRNGTEKDCLGPFNDALKNHSANQTLFATACAVTVGAAGENDPLACGFSVFNSQIFPSSNSTIAPPLVTNLTAVVAGQGVDTSPIAAQFFPSGAVVYENLAAFTERTLAELNRFPWVRKHSSPSVAAAGSGFGRNFVPTPLVPLSIDSSNTVIPTFSPGFGALAGFAQTGLSRFLTPEQQALLGCGPFYRTNCDENGIDLLNAEASALFQSFPGIDGTFGAWDATDRRVAQPGTVRFQGGPACTRFERGRTFILPGCRGPGDPGYNEAIDGATTGDSAFPINFNMGRFPENGQPRVHPFTGQEFRSEMAVLSWNWMMLLVGFSRGETQGTGTFRPDGGEINVTDPTTMIDRIVSADPDEFDPNRPFRTDGCSFAKPQLCFAVQGFLGALSLTRNTVNAGGNGTFGRRDFIWHQGTPVIATFDKNNILGFSMDFAEDITKTNWGFEATWVNDVDFGDANQVSGLNDVNLLNLTISVDRPTFVNFLNANRTFFFNAQLFIRWIDGYGSGMGNAGPWSFLGVFTAQTGYFQDRLLTAATFVYDKRSNSGAVLPQVTYRYNQSFSATVGVAWFFGRFQPVTMALNPIGGGGNRTGPFAYNDFAEGGLSAIRERDEIFLRLRYTF